MPLPDSQIHGHESPALPSCPHLLHEHTHSSDKQSVRGRAGVENLTFLSQLARCGYTLGASPGLSSRSRYSQLGVRDAMSAATALQRPGALDLWRQHLRQKTPRGARPLLQQPARAWWRQQQQQQQRQRQRSRRRRRGGGGDRRRRPKLRRLTKPLQGTSPRPGESPQALAKAEAGAAKTAAGAAAAGLAAAARRCF